MAAEEIPWGSVCRKVGFSDNLYADCRKNDPDYPLGGASAFLNSHPEEEVEEGGPDSEGFDKELAASALSIPPPPAAGWKPEPEGFFEALPIKQILMYGGVAAAAWFIVAKMRKEAGQPAVSAAAVAAPGEKVTSPQAA